VKLCHTGINHRRPVVFETQSSSETHMRRRSYMFSVHCLCQLASLYSFCRLI